MPDVTISGGGLEKALMIKLSMGGLDTPQPNPAMDRLLAAIEKVQQNTNVPKDKYGTPFTKPTASPQIG